MQFEFQFVSALEKVFCRETFTPEIPGQVSPALCRLHAVKGETAACQLMLKCDFNIELTFHIEAPEGIAVRLREVCCVPCDMPSSPSNPDAFCTEPGLYPDPLLPIKDAMRLSLKHWHAVYITVEVSPGCVPGNYSIPIHMKMFQPPGSPWKLPFNLDETVNFQIAVHDFTLPDSGLKCTHWFYCDCLSQYYRVELWSPEFWRIARNYWRDMAAHGSNMLYTPLWTPPLDTAIGHERPTTQLLKVFRKGGRFSFDFSLLKKFLEIAGECGIKYFEISHMFTQWGAKATPKIMVQTESGEEKMFGWHVAADSPLYKDFLAALLPELADFLRRENLAGNVYFHISDEPDIGNLQQYQEASALVHRFLPPEDFPVMDALSSFEFYRKKLLDIPVPTVNHFSDFSGQELRERWVYYAGDVAGYSGRSFGLRSCQNRIIGILFYLNRIDGFLHWGHNFWFGQYSLDYDLDPWRCTTAGRAFCGGGSFNVYPGPDGCPVDSLHYEIFTLGLQDLRLLRLLESKIGRDAVVKLIHEGLDYEITMGHFPRSAAYLENLHGAILRKLEESSAGY